MAVVNRLIRIMMAVSDMPKAKEFYADKLGLKVLQDYRQDDSRWWVSLALPEGGVTIALSTYHANMKPGTTSVYFATSDIQAAHQELLDNGVKAGDVKDDLYGPGSGVKWFALSDPDGNLIQMVQA